MARHDGAHDGGDDKSDKENAQESSGKAYSPYYQANNQGGFGNPPVRNQFRKNNPGGPGRPKGVTNLESAMRKVIGKKITVNKKGKAVKMLPAEIFAERVLEAVLDKNRSPAMLEYGRKLIEKYGTGKLVEQSPYDFEKLSQDELSILCDLLRRCSDMPPEPPEPCPLGPMHTYRVEGEYRVSRMEDGHVQVQRIE